MVALLALNGWRGDEAAYGLDGPSAPVGFVWETRYADALEAARAQHSLVAVYFRPVVGAEPTPMRFARKQGSLRRMVAGVRVGSTEVVELRNRFEITRFPGLVVLDTRERVLARWQGAVPPDVWTRVGRLHRQMEEQYAEEAKELARGRALMDSGQLFAAFARVRPLLRSRATSFAVFKAARKLEEEIVAAGEERILLALAAEGLVSDAELAGRLAGLFEAPIPPGLKEARDRELRRLETTTIGGRPTE